MKVYVITSEYRRDPYMRSDVLKVFRSREAAKAYMNPSRDAFEIIEKQVDGRVRAGDVEYSARYDGRVYGRGFSSPEEAIDESRRIIANYFDLQEAEFVEESE